MRLTTKGRFAVTAMIDIALYQKTEIEGHIKAVTLFDISLRQNISLSYLEQLFSKLRRKALVNSIKGPGGGYQLARDMSAITVADIILAVDEPIDATHCGHKINCDTGHNGRLQHQGQCMTHRLWQSVNAKLLDYLHSVTLNDLVQQELDNNKHIKKNNIVNHNHNQYQCIDIIDMKYIDKQTI